MVTLVHGHISAVVPQDTRLPDWEACLEYANALQPDTEFLASEREVFKQHFYANLDSAAQIARMYEKLLEVAAEFE